jgi:outer membrane receptor for ferrienterochelin and colicin
MIYRALIIFPVLLGWFTIAQGQGRLEGKIYDSEDKEETGLPGANVYWAGTSTGTSTNAAGYFSLKRERHSSRLVISFVGYRSDTIEIGKNETYFKHGLTLNNEISEIVITGKAQGSHLDKLNPILTTNITGAELRKAACCNLSESFETNASVDVNYSDAATGAKQIQLLGLAGTYTQILAENIPTLYGLATAYGLNYIPGPWMESIQVSKGTSSVRNGYESIAGQINVEYKKPAESEKLYVNGFISDAGRKEVNANTSLILSDKLSTMILAHGELQRGMNDHNDDGFRDEPDIKQYHLFNRWDYLTPNGDIRVGFKYLEEERIGGQLSYKPENQDTYTNGFGINIKTRRIEAFSKTGAVFTKDRSMSVGWINNFANHDQKSFFGRREYEGKQQTYYSNLLYQWNPGLGKSTIDAGLSYKLDHYDEALDSARFDRKESVPGVFLQYTYSDTSKIIVVAGIRGDFHNIYGTYITPRIHLRYEITPEITLRASAGKGYRSGNVLAENSYLLASSRDIIIAQNLREEEALNYGASLTGKIPVFGKKLQVTGEIYRTDFLNQIIIDLDADIHEVRFYNLDGKSFSQVYQVEASIQPVDGLDLLAAWRWNDVRMTIDGELRTKPLISRYKGLFTASYLTRLRKWQFDYTMQLNGPGRVPSTAANPVEYQRDDSFSAFTVMNAQVTRYFKKFQFYLGSENLLDFRQQMPVIGADDPFGNYFDSSLIWGPVHGRKIYAGFRFILNRVKN